MTQNPSTNDYAGREFVFTQVVNAPQSLTFEAWTQPVHMTQWWGPEGFTNPVCELDVRPGGALRIHMCSPDGTVYPMTGVFEEVEPTARLVFTSTPLDEKGAALFETLTTVTFEEQNGRTKVTVHARVIKTSPGSDIYLDGMQAGWASTLERLAHHVAEISR